MKVLVLVTHQDDEVLGCGATISKLARSGHEVHVASFALKTVSHRVFPEVVKKYRKMSDAACKILGVAHTIYSNFETEVFYEKWRDLMVEVERITRSTRGVSVVRPYDVVFFPWHHDLHQDHRTLSEAARFSLRGFDTMGMAKALLYPCPGSTGHDFSYSFLPNVYVPVSKKDVDRKIKALKCYGEEQREGLHPRSSDIVVASMRVAGAAMGVEYAEAFSLYREKWEF